MYKIMRYFKNGNEEVIKTGLTLEEAQEHCNDPETSSRTAKNADDYTEQHGEWFDGYDEERERGHKSFPRDIGSMIGALSAVGAIGNCQRNFRGCR